MVHTQDDADMDAVVAFLMVEFLSKGSKLLPNTAKVLRDEIQASGLLGKVTTWSGKERSASVEDFRGRFSEMAPDHIKRLFRCLLSEKQDPMSLMFPMSGVSRARDALAQKSPEPGSREDPTREDSVGLSRTMVELREQERAALAELAKLEQGRAQIYETERTTRSTGEKHESQLSFIERRVEELRSRIATARRRSGLLRRGKIREILIKRHRTSRNICDLIVAGSQLGLASIQSKIATPARDLSYSRLNVMKKVYGHKAFVFCVKVDPTGRWIVTGSDDSLLKLWNARTGVLCRTFRGHEKVIVDVSIDKSGKYIMSCSVDATVRLWELETGRNICVLSSHTKSVNAVDFDGLESSAISISDDGTCCIWDVSRIVEEDEEEIKRLMQHGARAQLPSETTSEPVVNAVAIAEAGLTSEFLPAKVPVVLPHIHDHEGRSLEVNCMSLRPQGGFAVTACDDGQLRIWATTKSLPAKCLVPERKRVRQNYPSATTRPNLVPGMYIDGANRLINRLHNSVFSVTSVAWSNKGDRILSSCEEDSTIRIWSWRFEDPDHPGSPDFFSHADRRTISVSSNDATVAFASSAAPLQGGSAEMPVRRTASSKYKVPNLDCCGWSSDDRYVIALQSIKHRKGWDTTEYIDQPDFFDQKVKIFDSYSGDLLHCVNSHRKPAYVLRMDPYNESIFVTGGYDGQLCVFDASSGRLLKKVQVPSQYGPLTILDAAFSPPGSSPSSLVATDAGGRLVFLGTDAGTSYGGAFPEQFFANDYAELVRDQSGNVLDARSQVPPHLAPRTPLVDSQGAQYDVDSSGDLTVEMQEKRAKECREQIKAFELTLGRNESAEMAKYAQRFARIDEQIKEANGKFRLARLKNQEEASERKKRFTKQQQKKKTDTSKTRASRTSRRGLLACEMEDGQGEGTPETGGGEEVVSDEAEDEKGSQGGSRADNQRSSRRQAKRRARKRIKTFQAHQTHSSDDEDANDDEQWAATNLNDELGPESSSDGGSDAVSSGYEEEPGARRLRKSRRLSAQTKKKRRKSRRNSFIASSEGDDDSDFGVSSSHRRRRKRRAPAVKKQQAGDWDRDWLRKATKPSATSAFIPQVGDVVVFFVQGHMEYLKRVPATESPVWQSRGWHGWPFVLCKVGEVSYFFPEPQGNDVELVAARVSMQLLGVPTDDHLSSVFPLDASELWKPPETGGSRTRASSTRPVQRFAVDLLPLNVFALPDFLVLKGKYEAAVACSWDENEIIRLSYAMGEHGDHQDFAGRIVEISDVNPDSYPGSTWESLVVRWDQNMPDSRVSMWETSSKFEYSAESDLSIVDAKLIADDFEEIVRTESCAMYFVDAVDLQENYDYSFVVPLPMELRLIITRLRSGYYRHKEALMADVDLIHSNCYEYNDSAAQICADVTKLQEILYECIPEPSVPANGASRGPDGKVPAPRSAGVSLSLDEQAATKRPALSRLTPKASSTVNTSDFVSSLQAILEKMTLTDRHSHFAHPVSADIAPNYADVIEHPMDLGTVSAKLQGGEYVSTSSGASVAREEAVSVLRRFEADLNLICNNALIFNEDGSLVNNEARKLKKAVDVQLRQVARSLLGISQWKCPDLVELEEDLAVEPSKRGRQGSRRGRKKKSARGARTEPVPPSRTSSRRRAASVSYAESEEDEDVASSVRSDYRRETSRHRTTRPTRTRGVRRTRSAEQSEEDAPHSDPGHVGGEGINGERTGLSYLRDASNSKSTRIKRKPVYYDDDASFSSDMSDEDDLEKVHDRKTKRLR